MLVLTCLGCKNEVVVNPHLYEAEILFTKDHLTFRPEYTARVRSEVICPDCGQHLYNIHSCPIRTSDIIELAVRRERQQ